MIHVENSDYSNILFIKVSGQVDEDYYDVILPYLEQKTDKAGSINILIEFENFDQFDPADLWKDFKVDVKHFHKLNRIAIVGKDQWMKWITELTKPFAAARIKYFKPEAIGKAYEWVNASSAR